MAQRGPAKTLSKVRALTTLVFSLASRYQGKIGEILKPQPGTPGFADGPPLYDQPTYPPADPLPGGEAYRPHES
jgi:hypothetical protein